MKITRKNLNKLVEAFIVGPEGPESTRHLIGKLTSELGTDTHHDVADAFIARCLNQINDPEMKRMLKRQEEKFLIYQIILDAK